MVVEVVLAGDEAPLSLEHAGEAVPHRRPADAADVDRSGRVRGNELQIDRDAVVQDSATEGLTLLDDRFRQGARSRGIQADVDETGAGDVDGCDTIDRLEPGREVCREFARVKPERLRQFHSDVGGPVAVLAVLRPLQRDVCQRKRGGRSGTPALQHSVHYGEQLGGELDWGHGKRFYRAARARLGARMERPG